MKRKWIVGILVASMVFTSIVITPKQAKAADETTSEIVYLGSDEGYDFTKYWDTRTVPVKKDCVFGGWYADDQGKKPLTEEEMASVDTAYAKFVPAYVLSIKAQVDDNTQGAEDGNTASLRLISSVDSKDYAKVGFKVLLSNDTEQELEGLETTKVYSGLVSAGESLTPGQIFGADSHFLSVWRLDGIVDACDAETIYVQPYWVTMDGTTVTGLAKFVHVEDSYMNYVSVPINLTTGESVAAGTLEMAYDSTELTLKNVEYGNVFTGMKHSAAQNGIVKFVGYSEVNEPVIANDIYANVRFTINSNATYEGAGTGNFLTFTIGSEEFCNWKEDMVAVDAWDVVY